MPPFHARAATPYRQPLPRLQRMLLVGLVLFCFGNTSLAFDVYRGLRISGDKLDLSPGAFRFNSELSLFDGGALHPPHYPCYLRVVLNAQPANPGDSSSAVDFAAYQVRFDNDPPGHYSMLAKAGMHNGQRISDTLKLMKARKPGEYKMLIVDGQRMACSNMDTRF